MLVSAMHITAGVFVNDWEDGLSTTLRSGSRSWRPPDWTTVTTRRAKTTPTRISSARSWDIRSILPITAGELDLGPWEQVFYAEFDGRRRKRVVLKVMGL